MLVLLDQGTPVGVRSFLHGHTVKTAYEQGWSTLLNGELLNAAERDGFKVLLTTDKNLMHQQNLSQRKIAVVILGASRWSLIKRVPQRIADAVNAAKPGTFALIEIPGGR